MRACAEPSEGDAAGACGDRAEEGDIAQSLDIGRPGQLGHARRQPDCQEGHIGDRPARPGKRVEKQERERLAPRCGGISHERRPARRSSRAEPARLARSEEQTSELQSLMRISYAVFCLKKKKQKKK